MSYKRLIIGDQNSKAARGNIIDIRSFAARIRNIGGGKLASKSALIGAFKSFLHPFKELLTLDRWLHFSLDLLTKL
jgi:hypothetical protein